MSVLASRDLKPKWERARLRILKRRHIERMIRWNDRIREEENDGDYESSEEESSKEESIA